MQIRKNLFNAFLLSATLAIAGCGGEDEVNPVVLEVQTAVDIPADPDAERGAPPTYTYFDLETGKVLDASEANNTQWDLALAGTSILVNGGSSGSGLGKAQVVEGIFEELEEAPEQGYIIDTEEASALSASPLAWYDYTGGEGTPAHAVLPIPGRVIMLMTTEGNYSKLEIISYYQGNPDTSTPEFANLGTRPKGRHYTFRYVVREDGKREFEN